MTNTELHELIEAARANLAIWDAQPCGEIPEEVSGAYRALMSMGPRLARVASQLIERNEVLREALQRISEGCGMLRQPAALNGPEAAWLRRRIEEYERTASTALSATIRNG